MGGGGRGASGPGPALGSSSPISLGDKQPCTRVEPTKAPSAPGKRKDAPNINTLHVELTYTTWLWLGVVIWMHKAEFTSCAHFTLCSQTAEQVQECGKSS